MPKETSHPEMKDEHVLRVLNPTVVHEFKPLSHAARLKDLSNKKIGLHWNNKARGDVALKRVQELLSRRFEGMTFEWFYSRVNIGVPEEWFEEVRRSGVDGIVGTTGD